MTMKIPSSETSTVAALPQHNNSNCFSVFDSFLESKLPTDTQSHFSIIGDRGDLFSPSYLYREEEQHINQPLPLGLHNSIPGSPIHLNCSAIFNESLKAEPATSILLSSLYTDLPSVAELPFDTSPGHQIPSTPGFFRNRRPPLQFEPSQSSKTTATSKNLDSAFKAATGCRKRRLSSGLEEISNAKITNVVTEVLSPTSAVTASASASALPLTTLLSKAKTSSKRCKKSRLNQPDGENVPVEFQSKSSLVAYVEQKLQGMEESFTFKSATYQTHLKRFLPRPDDKHRKYIERIESFPRIPTSASERRELANLRKVQLGMTPDGRLGCGDGLTIKERLDEMLTSLVNKIMFLLVVKFDTWYIHAPAREQIREQLLEFIWPQLPELHAFFREHFTLFIDMRIRHFRDSVARYFRDKPRVDPCGGGNSRFSHSQRSSADSDFEPALKTTSANSQVVSGANPYLAESSLHAYASGKMMSEFNSEIHLQKNQLCKLFCRNNGYAEQCPQTSNLVNISARNLNEQPVREKQFENIACQTLSKEKRSFRGYQLICQVQQSSAIFSSSTSMAKVGGFSEQQMCKQVTCSESESETLKNLGFQDNGGLLIERSTQAAFSDDSSKERFNYYKNNDNNHCCLRLPSEQKRENWFVQKQSDNIYQFPVSSNRSSPVAQLLPMTKTLKVAAPSTFNHRKSCATSCSSSVAAALLAFHVFPASSTKEELIIRRRQIDDK